MVFQNYALYPHMSVFDNMAFGLKLQKLPKAKINERVRDAARILGLDGACSSASRRHCRAVNASASRWAARSCGIRRRS